LARIAAKINLRHNIATMASDTIAAFDFTVWSVIPFLPRDVALRTNAFRSLAITAYVTGGNTVSFPGRIKVGVGRPLEIRGFLPRANGSEVRKQLL
jgi:hypothetical protein